MSMIIISFNLINHFTHVGELSGRAGNMVNIVWSHTGREKRKGPYTDKNVVAITIIFSYIN